MCDLKWNDPYDSAYGASIDSYQVLYTFCCSNYYYYIQSLFTNNSTVLAPLYSVCIFSKCVNFALIIITAMHCKGKRSSLATDPYRHRASKCGKCKYVVKYSCACIENIHTSLRDLSHRVRNVYFLLLCLISLYPMFMYNV